MFSIWNVICILVSVAIFGPFPSTEHFVFPLAWCMVADICNHTWVPECGFENETKEYRLFVDECDLFEYNCDYFRDYEIANFSDCFDDMCKVQIPKARRRGDYIFYLDGRKLIYDPIKPKAIQRRTMKFLPGTTRPILPKIMFHGKRRHTPEVLKRRMLECRMGNCNEEEKTTPFVTRPHKRTKKRFKPKTSTTFFHKLKATRPTIILRKMTIMKNGVRYEKVFKGFAPQTAEDISYME